MFCDIYIFCKTWLIRKKCCTYIILKKIAIKYYKQFPPHMKNDSIGLPRYKKKIKRRRFRGPQCRDGTTNIHGEIVAATVSASVAKLTTESPISTATSPRRWRPSHAIYYSSSETESETSLMPFCTCMGLHVVVLGNTGLQNIRFFPYSPSAGMSW